MKGLRAVPRTGDAEAVCPVVSCYGTRTIFVEDAGQRLMDLVKRDLRGDRRIAAIHAALHRRCETIWMIGVGNALPSLYAGVPAK